MALDGRGRVAVLSVLSVVGGWVQIPGVWHPFTQLPRADRRVARRAERDAGVARQHARASRSGVRRHRRRLGRLLRAHAPHPAGDGRARRARAQVLLRRALRRGLLPARRCCSRAALRDCVRAARSSSARSPGSPPAHAASRSELSEVQTGLVRTYALAIAGSVTVLALVFVWVKMTDWLATILIFLPLAGALIVWLLPIGRVAGPDRAALRARRGRVLDHRADSDGLRQHLGHAELRPAGDVVQRPRRLVPRRLLRVLVLAGRARGRRDGGCDRLRLLGRARAAARVLRADAVPDLGGRRASSPRRTCSSSTSSSRR